MTVFADVLEIKNGKNQNKVENPEGIYPIYGSGGIMGRADDYICPANTVVIGRKGSINKPIFVNEPFWNVDTAFGLVANKQYLLPRYLYYFCVYYDFEKLSTTVTIPSLTKANLLQIAINLPTINDQRKIVQTLGQIETIIEKRKNQLQAFDNLIKARFVELFGDPIQNDMSWPHSTMKAICTKITDGEHGSVPRTTTGHPFMNAKHIKQDGTIDWNTITYISNETHQRIYKRCNPEPGDVLMTTTGTIGNIAIVPHTKPFSMDRGITLLKTNRQKVSSSFIAWLLRFDSMQMIMNSNVHASAIGHLFLNKVEQLPIIIPPMPLQQQFATFVSQIEKSKSAVQSALAKDQLLFDSLMQKYFG